MKPTHFRPRRAYHSLMSKLMAYIASLFSQVRVEGLDRIPAKGGAVIVCNHFSYFDAFALTTALDRSGRDVMVLAKAELFRNRTLAWVLKRVGVIPVYRGSAKAQDSLAEAVNSLKHGELVALFPEGTIPKDGKLMEFKTGAVRMALEARVPIVPVAMVGTNRVIPSNFTKIKRTLFRRSLDPTPIRVQVGEPIVLAGEATDRAQVTVATAQVRATVERQLRSLGYPEATAVAPFLRKRDLALTVVFSLPVVGFVAERLWRRRKTK